MTGALRLLQASDELAEPRRRFDAELGPQMALIALIHPQGLRLVAFGEVGADERCLGAFA